MADGPVRGRPFAKGPDPRRRPAGLPPEYGRIREACRALSLEAVETLARAMRSAEDEKTRILAATHLLDRAWGRPQSAPEDLEAMSAGAQRPLREVATEVLAELARGE